MPKKHFSRAFSLVEVLLAGALMSLFVTVFVGIYVYSQESIMLSGNRNRAIFLAEEGLEALRNIRDNSFSDLVDGTHGLSNSGGEWSLSGSSNDIDIYTRRIFINEIDPNTKEITSQVSWQQNQRRTGEVELVSLLTNWRETKSEGSCDAMAVSEGYVSGICRQNTNKCEQNNEEPLVAGDEYCGNPPNDTCCVLAGEAEINSCDDFAIFQGYNSGICRKNRGKCNKNNEDHLSGGDQYCSGSNDTCCGE